MPKHLYAYCIVIGLLTGDHPDVPNIAILLSDGIATREELETLPQAAAARAEGINLFGIGIGVEV